MVRRYRLQNSKVFIEAPHNQEGKNKLLTLRSQMEIFKYSRIKSIIQAYPSKVTIGTVYQVW